MKKINVVVLAIIHQNNKFLLTKRQKLDAEDEKSYMHKWEIPGGGLEFGETPIQTVHREVSEELGIQVTVETLLPEIFTEVRNKWQGIFISYICTPVLPHPSITLNNESSDYGWFSIEEVRTLKVLPGVQKLLTSALDILADPSA